MNPVEKYYIDQASGIAHFSGPHSQRGHGLGGIFKSLFRAAVPLFKKAAPIVKAAAKTVAKEAARTGLNVIDDVMHDQNVADALAARGSATAEKLVNRGVKKLRYMMKEEKPIKRRRKRRSDIFTK